MEEWEENYGGGEWRRMEEGEEDGGGGGWMRGEDKLCCLKSTELFLDSTGA